MEVFPRHPVGHRELVERDEGRIARAILKGNGEGTSAIRAAELLELLHLREKALHLVAGGVIAGRQGGEFGAGGAQGFGAGLGRADAAPFARGRPGGDGGTASAECGQRLRMAVGGPAGQVGEGDVAGVGGRAGRKRCEEEEEWWLSEPPVFRTMRERLLHSKA